MCSHANLDDLHDFRVNYYYDFIVTVSMEIKKLQCYLFESIDPEKFPLKPCLDLIMLLLDSGLGQLGWKRVAVI